MTDKLPVYAHLHTEMLEALVRGSPLPIVMLDPDGRFVSWNPSAARTFGWSEEEALQAAANAIVITDRDGYIIWCNRAFLDKAGYPEAEAVGKRPGDLVKSGAHDDGFYRDLWNTISAGRVWCGEITNRNREGERYLEDMTITPIADGSGEITHFIAVKQDITERRQLE